MIRFEELRNHYETFSNQATTINPELTYETKKGIKLKVIKKDLVNNYLDRNMILNKILLQKLIHVDDDTY